MEAILITPENSKNLSKVKQFLKDNNIQNKLLDPELLEDLLFNDILIKTDKSEEVSEDVIFNKLLK